MRRHGGYLPTDLDSLTRQIASHNHVSFTGYRFTDLAAYVRRLKVARRAIYSAYEVCHTGWSLRWGEIGTTIPMEQSVSTPRRR